jgi:hypothetical protein
MPTAGAEDTEGGMIKFERHRAVGSLSKERVEAVPLRGSIIFITTAGIPLIKPEKLFR